MKTLNEHERQYERDMMGFSGEVFKEETKWKKAGVLCDKCRQELEYDCSIVLTSFPPQRKVRCLKCGFTGFMH